MKNYTPETAEVTRELARRLYKVIPSADIYVTITGLTTPGGSETAKKPVGTMFIHALIKEQDYAIREVFLGPAEDTVSTTVEPVANLLIESLKDID